MQMEFIRRLPIPKEIKEQFPVSEAVKELRDKRLKEMRDIITGQDDRLLLLIGPCSADNEEAVLDYMHRLKKVQEQVSDRILMVPRVYTGKPRTSGSGYKGMLHQPDTTKKEDMLAGILAIRSLHIRVVEETGFTCSDEMLYPDNWRYLSDILSYVAIGARSVENQQHRLTASGVGVPVGMKNPTEGDLTVMMNSIKAAQSGHTFVYRGWEVKTTGNDMAHAILRGYVDSFGNTHPNYHYEDLRQLRDLYNEYNLLHPAVVVDVNHANSGKKYLEQIRICKDVLHSCHVSADIRHLVKGLMIESYIEDGNQPVNGGCYGRSITDPCLGWEKSEKLVYEIADLWEGGR